MKRILFVIIVLVVAMMACDDMLPETPMPTATVEVKPIHDDWLMVVPGVVNVNVAVLADGIAYLEIDVLPEYNTSETAWSLYRAVQTVTADAALDFSVILQTVDGPAIDYVLDKRTDSFQETVLTLRQ